MRMYDSMMIEVIRDCQFKELDCSLNRVFDVKIKITNGKVDCVLEAQARRVLNENGETRDEHY